MTEPPSEIHLPNFTLEKITPCDTSAVANLIHHSTNSWHLKNRGFSVFPEPPSSCELFPQIYHELDPNQGILARSNNQIVGSCFIHPRPTHIGIGIVNTCPSSTSSGVASAMMDHAIQLSEKQHLPLRLVSSAMNLDSFSLYSKKGFRPIEFYQDMFIPEDTSLPPEHLSDLSTVRKATIDDLEAIVDLEHQISGIRREADWRYLLENKRKIWSLYVNNPTEGQIDGCLGAINHPASKMLGPGITQTEESAKSLIEFALRNSDHNPVFLIPSRFEKLVQHAYQLGAKNCELHILQVRGLGDTPNGITLPTFMPETG